MQRTIAMEEILHLTHALIRFRSTHFEPPGIFNRPDFIENHLKRNCIIFRSSDHKEVPFILITPMRDRFPVLILSHIDSVYQPNTRKGGRLC